MRKFLRLIVFIFLISLPYSAMAAIEFDGVDDYVTTTTMGNFGDGLDTKFVYGVFTFKTTDTTHRMSLAGTINTGSKTFIGFSINSDPTASTFDLGNIQLSRRDEGNLTTQIGVDSNTGITDGNIHQVIMSVTKDASTTPAIWLDGVSQTVQQAFAGAGADMANFGFPMVVGARNNRGTIDLFFSGTIYEAYIGSSTTQLTQQEAENLYSNIKRKFYDIRDADAGFCFAFDEQPDGTSWDGDTVYDLCGAGNNGTGVDGANNTGLTARGEKLMSYP